MIPIVIALILQVPAISPEHGIEARHPLCSILYSINYVMHVASWKSVVLGLLLISSKSRKSIFVPPVSETSEHSKEDDRLTGSEQ